MQPESENPTAPSISPFKPFTGLRLHNGGFSRNAPGAALAVSHRR
jgi:hypothetical protein